MKIRKLHLKNIGVFDDEEIEFKECPAKDKAEIHILTGENGSGKTTILQALASSFDYWENGVETKIVLSNNLHKKFRFLNYINPTIEVFLEQVVSDGTIKRRAKYYGDFNSGLARGYQEPKDYYFEVIKRDSLNLGKNFFGFTYAIFAYSGYRFIKSEKIESLREVNDFNPLYKSLEFIKHNDLPNQLTMNQLIANSFSKSGIEYLRGNIEKSEQFAFTIAIIERIISEVTGWKVEFDLQTEPTNLITKINGEDLDFEVLPDGLKSLISWIGDLLMRLDKLKWANDTPIFDREIILFLDEIEVHLHPAWQRKVLPVVQKLFKNAQIFVSTHSPFVVNSVDDAWVYELEVKDGKAKVREVTQSNTAYSIQTVLRDVFGIDEKFGEGTQQKLIGFLEKSRHIQQNNGNSEINKDEFLNLAVDLAEKSAEFQSIVFVELAKITQKTGEPYEI
jgi:predicted ATP-binding protein involved in virulence